MMDKTIDKSEIRDCTCKGVKILKDMTDFYTDEVTAHIKGEPRSKLIHERANKIADRLYNVLVEKETDVKYNVSEVILRNTDINRFKRGCEEGIKSDCIAKLEMLRQVLHNSSNAREKLVCTEDPEKWRVGMREGSPLASDIAYLMGKLFTGEFVDHEKGKILYNPYKRYIRQEIREECEKRDKYEPKA